MEDIKSKSVEKRLIHQKRSFPPLINFLCKIENIDENKNIMTISKVEIYKGKEKTLKNICFAYSGNNELCDMIGISITQLLSCGGSFVNDEKC